MSVYDQRLLGTWKSDPGDSEGVDAFGNVTLKFSGDGKLLYIVHEKDRDQIFDDQNSEDELGHPAFDFLLLECLDDDGRAGDPDDRAGEDALDAREAEHLPDQISDRDHHAALEQRDQAGIATNPHHLPDAELQTEGEHQQNDAELGKDAHGLWIGDERNPDVRAHDHAGQQIPEHNRLAQPLEDDRRHRRHA